MLSIFLITFFSHTLFSFVSSLFFQVHVLHYLFRYSFSRYTFFTIYFHSSFSRYTFFTLFFTLFFTFFFPGTLFSHFFFTICFRAHFFHTFFPHFFSLFFFRVHFFHILFSLFFSRYTFFQSSQDEKSVLLRGKQSKLVKKVHFPRKGTLFLRFWNLKNSKKE